MTCSHMSYFFISKQLLWELFFRISNSKATSKMIITENLEKEFANSPSNSISFLQCQKADDNPRKGILTLCINYKTAPTWGFQYVFSYGNIYFRSIGNGTFSDWQQIK